MNAKDIRCYAFSDTRIFPSKAEDIRAATLSPKNSPNFAT
jgi:hypothetical protein